jgi:hypothetical protein
MMQNTIASAADRVELQTRIHDREDRPVPVLDYGEAIAEIL